MPCQVGHAPVVANGGRTNGLLRAGKVTASISRQGMALPHGTNYNTLMTIHEARFRVRYAETDQMGVVYYANYLIWMEIGRAEYCRAAGIRYKDMESADGIRLAVVDAHCRYLHPARYDEEIAVKTWIARANRRMIQFEYHIREAESAQTLAEGETKHIFLGADMRPVKLPEKYHACFGLPNATD